MDGPDRLERLTDLVLVLLSEGRARTLEEIARNVPGYPDGHDARRQAFERDKRLLRDEGIPVITETVEGPEQKGYRIDPDAYYLPDPGLSADERTALALAVAAVHVGDPSGRDALAKLGAPGSPSAPPIAAFEPPSALSHLFDAVRSSTDVTFVYQGETRALTPAKVVFGHGHWYLIGWDHGRESARTFRVDRIEGSPVLSERGRGVLPDGFAAQAVPEPWRAAERSEDDITVLIDSIEATLVVREVGEGAVVERRSDGSVVLALGVTDWPTMRSWLLDKAGHVELLGPPSQRRRIIEWLEAIAARPVGEGREVRVEEAALPETTARESKLSGRLRRLLAMISWLAERKTATIAELCERFDMTPEQVTRELELAACCGTPPYTPGSLLEIVVESTRVETFLPEELARPRRLTPAEGLALATAGGAILAVPGADSDGALARALAKLNAVLGSHDSFEIDLPEPVNLAPLRAAIDERKKVTIDYRSTSNDEITTRVVEPRLLAALEGQWYLEADCLHSGGRRRFRVDRIGSLQVSDEAVSPSSATSLSSFSAFVPGPDALAVAIALEPAAMWLLDNVAHIGANKRSDGRVEATLWVGGRAWLERVLLVLGLGAELLGPPTYMGLGAQAAASLLAARYGSVSTT